jgi:transposase
MPHSSSAEQARILDFLDTGSANATNLMEASMEVLHAKCAGLDVHKDSVVACARSITQGTVQRQVETFQTTTQGLTQLQQWLQSQGCTHVAMEATGVYWKPVWHMLEEDFELVLANAAQVRNVPGRKSDINDATWLADLLAHGLIRASFVPPAPIQQMRDLTRTRKQLVREVAQHTQRIHKVLEDANLKVASVITDMLGMTGRAILKALVEGQSDPEHLADLARGRLKAKREQLVEALHGRVTDHHRFLLKLHLEQIDALTKAIDSLEERMTEVLAPMVRSAQVVSTIPGVSTTAARVIIAEIGTDMSRFATAGHLLSWAGLCPRMDESAGKRRSTRVRPGAPWLKSTLVQCAWSAARSHGTYLRAQFLRLKSRRGPKKAILAVAASMLTAAYHMLRQDVLYKDLGPDYFQSKDKERLAKRLLRRLKDLGVHVTPVPTTQEA